MCLILKTIHLPLLTSSYGKTNKFFDTSTIYSMNLIYEKEVFKKTKNIEKINNFCELSDNWNGYNAKKISSVVIEKAITLLDSFDFQPKVFPTGRNTIQFELEDQSGKYIEFEITENEVEVFFVDAIGNSKEWSLSHISEVAKALSLYYEA